MKGLILISVLFFTTSFLSSSQPSQNRGAGIDTVLLIEQVVKDYSRVVHRNDTVFYDKSKFGCPTSIDGLKVICFNANDKKESTRLQKKYGNFSFIKIKGVDVVGDTVSVSFGNGSYILYKGELEGTIIGDYPINYKINISDGKFKYEFIDIKEWN